MKSLPLYLKVAEKVCYSKL